MAVDRYTSKHDYYNDYEVQDFYIRFPHYEKFDQLSCTLGENLS